MILVPLWMGEGGYESGKCGECGCVGGWVTSKLNTTLKLIISAVAGCRWIYLIQGGHLVYRYRRCSCIIELTHLHH